MKKSKLKRKLRKAIAKRQELEWMLFWKNSTIDSMKKTIETMDGVRKKLYEELTDGQTKT